MNKSQVKRRIGEALEVLRGLGFPRQQINERSALTLLSLLGLKPGDEWSRSAKALMGITPMMEFFAAHYGKHYAPNTRETVRRQTIHQFVQAGLVVPNPDDFSRPTNSPKAVYQIEESALKLMRGHGTRKWDSFLREYLRSAGMLKKIYAREREIQLVPVTLGEGKSRRDIRLSAGAHNELVKKIVADFCGFFTPGARVLYVGDTRKKWAYYDSEGLEGLGVKVEEHGKMPDAIIHDAKRNWLVLIEAVTSHGPVSPKRRQELKALFAKCKAGLVYVTAFLDRRAMMKHIGEISWETEVWIAETPTHLIHFNGERFLGPYEK